MTVTTGMEPVAEQDIRFGDPDSSPTPWAAALGVLETAELYWIATVRDDGRPHVTPLPAVWDDDRLHFCTGPAEQKAVNLARNRHVTLTTGCNRWKEGLDVVVEGDAVQVTGDSRLRVLADLWRSKYHGEWDFAVEGGVFRHGDGGSALVFEVVPTKVLAFAKGRFAQTRYRFGSTSPGR
jgi:nitroimidazol reductase NimA-like FMN-containing flavoprotein (pyridoxamine 5'-phosphate oxidase superfamily)